MVIKNTKNEKIVLLETNNSDCQWFMLNWLNWSFTSTIEDYLLIIY
jgi:hypothetical protein